MRSRFAPLFLALSFFPAGTVESADSFTLATFTADITPPDGHVLFTGRWLDSTGVTSRLEARGFVLVPPGDQKPVVFCATDWAEIRNDAYDRWRDVLAEAAGTERVRVLVSAIHQHDTPLADLEAQRILETRGSKHQVIDLEFHEKAVQRVAASLRQSLKKTQPVSHIGIGQAEVEKIASNRRYADRDGRIHYNRMSACKILTAQRAGVGDIDPMLKSISFWNGDRPLCVMSVYATHPMSFYGTGKVDADFPGLARAKRQKETPGALQIYASGCSGNVTAGKFNDGRPETRPILAGRLHAGMKAAFEATEKLPLESMDFRSGKLRLAPRNSEKFTVAYLEKQIADTDDARAHGMAAIGLSWRKRADDPDYRIDVPLVRFNDGRANLLLLPGEIYVEYQLFANAVNPEAFVATIGYGESAPGYIPIERAWEENDSNLGSWCWVAEGMQERIEAVIERLLSNR